jgi:glucokinase
MQEAHEQAIASPALARELLRLAGGEPAAITGPIVTQAAQSGDVAALQCFDEVGRWLGRGIAQLAAILDPGVSAPGPLRTGCAPVRGRDRDRNELSLRGVATSACWRA